MVKPSKYETWEMGSRKKDEKKGKYEMGSGKNQESMKNGKWEVRK